MERLKPRKLKSGSHIRVISPSTSLKVISPATQQIAMERLQRLGFTISFGENFGICDEFRSSPVQARVEDLHAAFLDPDVDGILTVLGGYNSNQLLKFIDYEIIRSYPKVFCGFSDITALANAFFTKAGLVSYSGPHFSSFGMKDGFDYTEEYFKKCCLSDEHRKDQHRREEPFEISPSAEWSDDLWFLEDCTRKFIPNDGLVVLNKGSAHGTLVGGNLITFALHLGTEYTSIPAPSVLFIEDDAEAGVVQFNRSLQRVILDKSFSNVKGLVIGRFQENSKISMDILTKIVRAKPELTSLPIIANADFGHTTPFCTFPIGGEVEILAAEGNVSITINSY